MNATERSAMNVAGSETRVVGVEFVPTEEISAAPKPLRSGRGPQPIGRLDDASDG
jgi:hypothetical protein